MKTVAAEPVVIASTSNSTIGEESSSVLLALTLLACISALMDSLLENDCEVPSMADEFTTVEPFSSFTMKFIVAIDPLYTLKQEMT